ncbi:MAG: hypothetical protein WC678_02785 [Parcubacteria group bacterium]|jgi:hypothetical protein
MKILNFPKKVYLNIVGYKLTNDIQEFIGINKKHWGDFHGDSKNGYILMTGLKNSASNFVASGRVAKSIEEETGCLPIVLVDALSFSSGYWKKIYGSYDISNFLFYRNYRSNIFLIFKSLFLTVKFYFKQKGINDLLRLEFENIRIGDLIYDTILRFNIGLYTIDKVRMAYFGDIYSAFLLVMIYEKIFKKYDIKYICPDLSVFTRGGIPLRIADKNGATVILASRRTMKSYEGLDIFEGKHRPRVTEVNALRESKNLYKDIDSYFKNRFSGSVNEMDVLKSYKGKIEYDKEYFCKCLNLDENKPIVFIMSHAFSDGPHHTPMDKLLFRDFYVWLVETLKCVSDIDNVNWVVKPHPMSFKYEEEGEVEKLVKLYGKNNIHIVPKDFNTKSIKDIADVLVTVQGKSGLEFSCFGIPAIITSQASYSGFGFTVEPKNVEEYFNLLKNIPAIPKLNEDQIKSAKVLSAIMFLYSRTNDPLFPPREDIVYFRYNEKARWKQNCLLMEKYDRSKDEFYQRVKDLINLNLYRKYLN